MSSATPAPAPRGEVVTYRQVLRHRLEEYRPIIARLLEPTGVSEAAFVAQVANATRHTARDKPDPWAKVEPETTIGAVLRCAQIGLPPNDGSSMAWVIPYGREAVFQLGYGGVMELARRAVPGIKFQGSAVYPGDSFTFDEAHPERFSHVPHYARKPRREQGGEAFAFYVIVDYPDGHRWVHALPRERIDDEHRKFSRQPNAGMWADSYNAAALKSVVLDMRRWLPHSPQLARAIQSEGEAIDVRDMADEVTPEDIGELPAGGEE